MSNLPSVNTEAGAILEAIKTDIAPFLADNGQSYDRLKATFLIAVQQEPKILLCTPDSLRREISKCAADGLVPDAKEAVLLPYYDNKDRVFIAQYQPMVHGIIKRMRELGNVFQITCNLVYEKDDFTFDEADPDSISHKSDRFAKDRGAIVGGYVIFRDERKRVLHLETMSAEDFETVRQTSKAPNSPAWAKWKPEMCRKAVLRRGAKYISTNNDKIRALIERQDDMFDFNQPKAVERFDPFTGAPAQAVDNRSASPMLDYQPQATVNTTTSSQAADVVLVGDKAQDVADAAGGQRNRQEKPAKPASEPAAQSQSIAKQNYLNEAPKLPDFDINDDDRAAFVERASKCLRIANEHDIAPEERRVILKDAAPTYKEKTPAHLHEALAAVVAITDWCIQREANGMVWSGDHTMFSKKLASALGVDKLDVGKYR